MIEKNMASGKLKVKVVNGRNLTNKETFQTSDPYCKIEIGGEGYKTKTKKGNLNPDWNEEFVFTIKPECVNEVIALSVWDKNTIKKDVFMGYAFATFDDCKKGSDTEKKATLLGDCKGEINLLINPDFETSATKIETMEIRVKEVVNTDDTKEKLEKEIQNLTEEKSKLKTDNTRLNEEIRKLTNDAKTMSDEKNELVMINENLKNEKENLQGNSETLSDHVEKLNKQIEDLKKEIEKLKTVEETITVKEVNGELSSENAFADLACKRDEIYKRLAKENEKLHEIKTDLLQELMGFQTVQELIFIKLNEQMRALQPDKSKADEIKEELKQQIMGFEKVQELIFHQFNGKVKAIDLSLIKQIVEDIKDIQ